MNEDYQNIERCFLCNSSKIEKIFSVEEVCLTGYFPLKDEKDPLNTPVSLVLCRDCGNIQARELVNPDLMFRDYWYRSSTTSTMKQHLKDLVDRFSKENGILLDIGSNDGTLMEMAKDKGMDVWGVEPSDALKDASSFVKDRTVNSFFGDQLSDEFLSKLDKKFDLITAISMFYDVPNPLDFILKAKDLLSDSGVLVIEVNYAKSFFERENIDMLGQEHLIYYFINTFSKLIKESGLYINDAYLTDMNGGNITFSISKRDLSTERLENLKKEEDLWLEEFDFQDFENKVKKGFDKLKDYILELSSDKVIKVLGASTRGAMIIQMLGLNNEVIKSAVDLQRNKVGRRIPGTNIEIEFDGDHSEPDFYLVMPYQFKKEIIERYTNFMKKGGGLLFYRPSQEAVTYDELKEEILHSPIV